MRIEAVTRERDGDRTRVAANVVWEDTARPSLRVHFETTAAFAEDLQPSVHPFLTAAIVPALRAGEARITVEGAVCPTLRDGLTTAMQILNQWWGPSRSLVAIEPRDGFRPSRPPDTPRTGMLLSGGFDSLATLRRNRQSFPLDHPSSVRDCLFVYGFDIGTPGAREGEARCGPEGEARCGPEGEARCGPDQTEFFEAAAGTLRAVTDDAGASLIPVWTNLRHLDPDGRAWPDEWYGIAAASIAHAFAPRLSCVLLAGGLDVGRLMPIGSHPMLDPYFGSAGLAVLHDGAHLPRVEKMRLVADWDVAIRNVRVCWAGIRRGGPLNCGRCHKCLITMMGLVALGKLDRALSFPVREVTPGMLESLRLDNPYLPTFYRELIAPLEAAGRRDLTRVIAAKLDEYERTATRDNDGAHRLARGLGRTLGRIARRFA